MSTDLSAYTETDFQVWVYIPTGGRYAYRTDLIPNVALLWSACWNEQPPSDVPPGSTFHAVRAITTFDERS